MPAVSTDDHPLDAEQLAARLLETRERFLGYIQARIADPELAEDILQDSLLRATSAAAGLRDTERLAPWFYRILQNAIVDAYRRRGVERRHLTSLEPGEPSYSPDDEATLCDCFRALLPSLKPEYADLIQSLDLGNETPETTAARLGITPNNLKVRRHRARQALRRRLEATCTVCARHGCLDCTCRAD